MSALLISSLYVKIIILVCFSCEDIEFSVEDIHAYAHLLFVGLSLKLYQGDLQEALSIGSCN